MSNKLVKNSLLQNNYFLEEKKIGFLGMPPYEQNDFKYPFEIDIELLTEQDAIDFVEKLGADYKPILTPSKITKKFYWYPLLKKGEMNTSLSYIWIEDKDV